MDPGRAFPADRIDMAQGGQIAAVGGLRNGGTSFTATQALTPGAGRTLPTVQSGPADAAAARVR